MSLPIERLHAVIALEKKKGFQNTAVIGGFDKFLANWAAEVATSISDKTRLTKFNSYIGDFDYALKAIADRRLSIENLLSFVEEFRTPTSVGVKSGLSKPVDMEPPQIAEPSAIYKKKAPKSKAPAAPPSSLSLPVTTLKGISEATAAKYKKLGITGIRDLLYHFPTRHVDYSQTAKISSLLPGPDQTIVANIWEVRLTTPGGRRSTEAILGDETGNIRALWFNNPYLVKQLHNGDRVVISGRVSDWKGRLVFESPEWEKLEEKELVHTGRLVPVYPLTAGLFPRAVRKLMKEVVDGFSGSLSDYLPSTIRQRRGLTDLPSAISHAHFPEDELSKNAARVRLAFDELFFLQLGVLARKRAWQHSQPASAIPTDKTLFDRFLKSLSFSLTGAQQKSLNEILADLKRTEAMSRLLQGEVGSGKTVVATAAILMAVAAGFQAAFMAPTEILAEQHFRSLTRMLELLSTEKQITEGVTSYIGILPDRPLSVALLIGDAKESGKTAIRGRIKNGDIDLVIGTHALIQKDVKFKILGLAVIDEQHRFGVEQRLSLRQKGTNPHILVMTATPIPRTLALTLYGDLDLSVINELPPGRQTIKTRWLKPEQRASAYAFIRKQVDLKQQAFIICPLVEESEAVQARAATAEYENLKQDVFPDFKLGLLHGRMPAVEKDSVMGAFSAGKLDILVSTPVIEVGIDVPNATVMLIESADRFGLSQLHQFRGRVGRGTEQSYCMLLAENPSEVANARLSVIEKTQDGFILAEEDLKLRGPGEFFGTRQSGLPDLKMAKLSDVPILEMAREEATRLFQEDPGLKKPEHRALYDELIRIWPQTGEWS
ncbi:ATP-dependent DNA helicase RecG [Dehalogenimonas etheniformans]|uniref:ATP-dependent DNA helicase RecG n=1 Tax=Dehalogenimonas etheniformans TaxID=1536648 RepID=A0A2P5P5S9_9CHLR|nr:ATP-dependent DNA helicase RecG [Dehalogenimonas etheniformans]PPD57656.1 ATP-dependent DNA helicase RecG [Dehalogenimonas etheniformans]QNT75998.1 ATP-dependent DNA helicase RecG [Dehalogenimonas etheniformans]